MRRAVTRPAVSATSALPVNSRAFAATSNMPSSARPRRSPLDEAEPVPLTQSGHLVSFRAEGRLQSAAPSLKARGAPSCSGPADQPHVPRSQQGAHAVRAVIVDAHALGVQRSPPAAGLPRRNQLDAPRLVRLDPLDLPAPGTHAQFQSLRDDRPPQPRAVRLYAQARRAAHVDPLQLAVSPAVYRAVEKRHPLAVHGQRLQLVGCGKSCGAVAVEPFPKPAFRSNAPRSGGVSKRTSRSSPRSPPPTAPLASIFAHGARVEPDRSFVALQPLRAALDPGALPQVDTSGLLVVIKLARPNFASRDSPRPTAKRSR